MDYQIRRCQKCGTFGRHPRVTDCVMCKRQIRTFARPGEPATGPYLVTCDATAAGPVHLAYCSPKCALDWDDLRRLNAQFGDPTAGA